jgi:hypothetical protein
VGIAMPELILENRDGSRRVTAVELAFDLPTTRDRSWIEVPIPSTKTTTLRMEPREWSVVVPAGDEDLLTIRVIRARFEDGEGPGPPEGRGPELAPRSGSAPRARRLGDAPQPGIPSEGSPVAREAPLPPETFEAPPDMPPPGLAPRALPSRPDRTVIQPLPIPRGDVSPRPEPRPEPGADDHGWIMARFRNPDHAPVVIVDARTAARAPDEERNTGLPEIVIENRGDRWVRSLRVRYKADAESHAVSGYDVAIRPHGSVFIHREDYEIPGRAEDMTVQILGARFDDGTVWGTMDSRIDARDEWVYPLSPMVR